jgi:hypothetical protein
MIQIETFQKCMSKELLMPIETFKNMEMLIKKKKFSQVLGQQKDNLVKESIKVGLIGCHC